MTTQAKSIELMGELWEQHAALRETATGSRAHYGVAAHPLDFARVVADYPPAFDLHARTAFGYSVVETTLVPRGRLWLLPLSIIDQIHRDQIALAVRCARCLSWTVEPDDDGTCPRCRP